MILHLVRHGRPRIEQHLPPSEWPLSDSSLDDLARLATVLRDRAGVGHWHSSDEPKALATARHLAHGPVAVVPGLREAVRSSWVADSDAFRACVLRSFREPDRPAETGWEPLAQTRRRVRNAVDQIIRDASGTEVVLVGHGTAWTLLVADLLGQPPDVDGWLRLRAPDVCSLDLATRTLIHPWGAWD